MSDQTRDSAQPSTESIALSAQDRAHMLGYAMFARIPELALLARRISSRATKATTLSHVRDLAASLNELADKANDAGDMARAIVHLYSEGDRKPERFEVIGASEETMTNLTRRQVLQAVESALDRGVVAFEVGRILDAWTEGTPTIRTVMHDQDTATTEGEA